MLRYTHEEENVMYRLQLIVEQCEEMNEHLLRRILFDLLPEERDPVILSAYKLEDKAISWWMYAGQWEWPQWSIGRQSPENLSERLIKKYLPNPDITYPSDEYEFGVDLPDDMLESFELKPGYAFEIRPLIGKSSLWPKIYPCDDEKSVSAALDILKNTPEDKVIIIGCQKKQNTVEE